MTCNYGLELIASKSQSPNLKSRKSLNIALLLMVTSIMFTVNKILLLMELSRKFTEERNVLVFTQYSKTLILMKKIKIRSRKLSMSIVSTSFLHMQITCTVVAFWSN